MAKHPIFVDSQRTLIALCIRSRGRAKSMRVRLSVFAALVAQIRSPVTSYAMQHNRSNHRPGGLRVLRATTARTIDELSKLGWHSRILTVAFTPVDVEPTTRTAPIASFPGVKPSGRRGDGLGLRSAEAERGAHFDERNEPCSARQARASARVAHVQPRRADVDVMLASAARQPSLLVRLEMIAVRCRVRRKRAIRPHHRR